MANTQKYLNHLLQSFGFSPAGSGDEQNAAEEIVGIFKNHGFDAQVEPVVAKTGKQVPVIVMGLLTFVGAILTGFGGFVFWIGLLLCLGSAALLIMERLGKPVIKPVGKTVESQNVVAYHKASGPLASPRNRPVVVVAHYDSPRMDPLCDVDKAHFRPLLVKLAPLAIVAVPVIAFIKVFPLADVARVVVWFIALLVSLVPAALAVHGVMTMTSKQFSTGSVCNKSSVAAMLGIMDKVAPFEGEEFPQDIPFEEYMESLPSLEFEEEVSEHEDQDLSDFEVQGPDDEESLDLGSTNAMPALDATGVMSTLEEIEASREESESSDESLDEKNTENEDVVEDEFEDDTPSASEEQMIEQPSKPAALRRGEETLRNLGMLPVKCEIVYDLSDDDTVEEKNIEDVSADEPVDQIDVPEDIVEEIVEVEASAEDASDDEAIEDEAQVEAESAEELTTETVIDEIDESFVERDVSEPINEAEFEDEDEEEFNKADELFDLDSSEFDVIAQNDGLFVVPPVEEIAEEQQAQEDIVEPGETQAFSVDQVKAAQDAAVDALMAEISKPVEHAPEKPTQSKSWGVSSYSPAQVNTPVDLGATVATPAPIVDKVNPRAVNPMNIADPAVPSRAQRSSLFDLPDPSSTPQDPFAVGNSAPMNVPSIPLMSTDGSQNNESYPAEVNYPVASDDDYAAAINPDSFQVLSAPVVKKEEKQSGGFSRLFGRKKKEEQSMSDWLGVDDSFSAKESGRNIGSWDNFGDDGWKGGAASSEGATPDEMLEAITSLGDDELLGHDIWFVATGASECGHAGMEQFLIDHRDKLRGVFMINLESIGAGETSIITREGMDGKLKGDRRISSLLNQVSEDFHQPFENVEMPYLDTEASAAINMHLRAVTIAGVDGPRLACSYSHDDVPQNINAEKIDYVAEVVTEVIRRS